MTDIKNRGVLTDEIKNKYGITRKELRLMPYLQYLLVNQIPIDPRKIDQEEREILQKWRNEGKITFSMKDPCSATKEFWDQISDIIYDTYVFEIKDSVKDN